VKRTINYSGQFSNFFSRPLHGLLLGLPSIPAMNRWAIFSRPLGPTKCRPLFVQSHGADFINYENRHAHILGSVTPRWP